KIEHSFTHSRCFEWIERFTVLSNFGNQCLIACYRRRHGKLAFRIFYVVGPRGLSETVSIYKTVSEAPFTCDIGSLNNVTILYISSRCLPALSGIYLKYSWRWDICWCISWYRSRSACGGIG